MFYMDHIEHVLYGFVVPRRRGKGANAPRGVWGALPPGRGVCGGFAPSVKRRVWGAAGPPMIEP